MSDLGIDQKIFIGLGGLTMISAFAVGAYLFIIIQQDERDLFLSVPRIKSNLYETREYVRRLHLGLLMAAVVFVLTGLLLGYTEFAAGTKLALACIAVAGSLLHLVFRFIEMVFGYPSKTPKIGRLEVFASAIYIGSDVISALPFTIVTAMLLWRWLT